MLTPAGPPLSVAPVPDTPCQALILFIWVMGVRSWSDGLVAFSPHWDWLLSSQLCVHSGLQNDTKWLYSEAFPMAGPCWALKQVYTVGSVPCME